MMYGWHTVALPNNTFEEKLLASEFLRLLVLNTPNQRNAVFNYNVEVVKYVSNIKYVSNKYWGIFQMLILYNAKSQCIGSPQQFN